jgi:hypothetical protein
MEASYNGAMFMDEATFHINGCISHYNCRSQQLNKFLEYICGARKVNVWCGLLHNSAVWPYLFVEITTTGDICLHLLQQFVFPHVDDIERENATGVIFQLDGSPPHFIPQV